MTTTATRKVNGVVWEYEDGDAGWYATDGSRLCVRRATGVGGHRWSLTRRGELVAEYRTWKAAVTQDTALEF